VTPAESLHLAACAALGLDPEAHGTQAAVARAVGADTTTYHLALRGRRTVTADKLLEWAGRVGVRAVVEPGQPVVFDDAEAAERARCLAWAEYVGGRPADDLLLKHGGEPDADVIHRGIDSGEWPPKVGGA
jgi:hypothetical protein